MLFTAIFILVIFAIIFALWYNNKDSHTETWRGERGWGGWRGRGWGGWRGRGWGGWRGRGWRSGAGWFPSYIDSCANCNNVCAQSPNSIQCISCVDTFC